MSKTSHDRKKLAGQLKALEEHLDKEERYPHEYDKAFARRTQENVIEQINRLLQRHGWGREQLIRILEQEGMDGRVFEEIMDREGW